MPPLGERKRAAPKNGRIKDGRPNRHILDTYLRYVILALLVKAPPPKQDPQVVSWEDNRYGIQEMAIDEYYGLGIINEGWSMGKCLAPG